MIMSEVDHVEDYRVESSRVGSAPVTLLASGQTARDPDHAGSRYLRDCRVVADFKHRKLREIYQ